MTPGPSGPVARLPRIWISEPSPGPPYSSNGVTNSRCVFRSAMFSGGICREIGCKPVPNGAFWGFTPANLVENKGSIGFIRLLSTFLSHSSNDVTAGGRVVLVLDVLLHSSNGVTKPGSSPAARPALRWLR